jgi:hypothetical protein
MSTESRTHPRGPLIELPPAIRLTNPTNERHLFEGYFHSGISLVHKKNMQSRTAAVTKSKIVETFYKSLYLFETPVQLIASSEHDSNGTKDTCAAALMLSHSIALYWSQSLNSC